MGADGHTVVVLTVESNRTVKIRSAPDVTVTGDEESLANVKFSPH